MDVTSPALAFCGASGDHRRRIHAGTVSIMTLLRATIAAVLVALNTVLHCTPLFLFAAVKLLLPIDAARRALSVLLVRIGESWIAVNSFLIEKLTAADWQVEGVEGLRRDGWYLVVSNHQSWVDIPVLQKAFNRRIPFLKFFLKSQLIWVPMLGLAWWALDFPFMKRYTRRQIEQRPELAGKDIEATRRACAKFARLPVSVMNFVEGTRFTPAKHAAQQSPFAHLLRPKAGGTAFVLQAMGDILQSLIDVTIVYPQGRPTLVDLLAGRVRRVRVVVRQLPIPRDMLGGDYEGDPAFRARFQQWINDLWVEKDALIARMREA